MTLGFTSSLILHIFTSIAPLPDVSDGMNSPNRSEFNGADRLISVGVVGEESGRIVSIDPRSQEARVSEASGTGRFCGRSVGTLSLIKHKNMHFIIGNAHSFYDAGQLKCDEAIGYIAPDLHYSVRVDGQLFDTEDIDRKRLYSVNLPPLNDDFAMKFTMSKIDPYKINDLAVLEIYDTSIFQNQFGQLRAAIELSPTPPSQLADFSRSGNIFITSRRANFLGFAVASIEYGCQINDTDFSPLLKKHSCDTGPGTSGSLLTYLDADGAPHAVGMHYGGGDSTMDHFNDSSSREGNFFIPSSVIIEALDRITEHAAKF
ncbi:hypothetical protein LCGC14_0271240 [marine sediment metagenome]|uniref:Peptidase S1 domain-containing protein n=1 Tax=marine sediment metagenome TaxID=412755 RepID=A0A0F9TZ20_9ZZZZ